jgi:outer membrane protein assembly factor BamB
LHGCQDRAPLWESSLGKGHEWAVARLQEWRDAQDEKDGKPYFLKGGENPWIRNDRSLNVFGEGADASLFGIWMPQLAVDRAGGGTNGVLVCHDGRNGLIGLDLATGTQRWYQADSIAHYQSPTVWYVEGHPYVLHGASKGAALVCRDALSGTVAWELKDVITAKHFAPTTQGSYIVVPSHVKPRNGDESLVNLSCYRADAKGATRLWTLDRAKHVYPKGGGYSWIAPVIYRDHVYVRGDYGSDMHGAAYACVELATGTLKGVVKTAGREAFCSLLASDGRLFSDWEVLDADPNHFRLLMSIDPRGRFGKGNPWPDTNGDALSAFVHGKIYFRDGTVKDSTLPITDRVFQTNLLMDGFYYYRGPHHIYCIDVRKHQDGTKEAK